MHWLQLTLIPVQLIIFLPQELIKINNLNLTPKIAILNRIKILVVYFQFNLRLLKLVITLIL